MNTISIKQRIVTEEQHKNLVTLYNWLKEDKDVPDEIYHYHKSFCLWVVMKAMKMKRYSEGDRNILNCTIDEYNKIQLKLKS